ncbi:hypothetical protein BN871_CS_00040 [Paenibacillus sp. P22]|nr:hypothetical protein BN871_CS_00040 [Paenibacillus sp. P22]
MLSKDIGIDLGTANVSIHVKGRGVVLDEPSVVAVETGTKRVLAVGDEAYRMVGRTPGNIVAIRPLRDGVIADFEITEMMLKAFIDRIGGRSWYSRPRILICAPTNITSVEQKAIREAAERCGAKEVYMEEEPKAAAIGAGMDIYQPSGNMVVDIGRGHDGCGRPVHGRHRDFFLDQGSRRYVRFRYCPLHQGEVQASGRRKDKREHQNAHRIGIRWRTQRGH